MEVNFSRKGFFTQPPLLRLSTGSLIPQVYRGLKATCTRLAGEKYLFFEKLTEKKLISAILILAYAKIRIAVFLVIFFLGFADKFYSLSLPIKELVRIGSMRENQLTGYGLVVGLPGSGDKRSTLTNENLKRILSFRGVITDETDFKSSNVASVMVTAKVPSVALPGDTIDIWVSSIGNAKSLKGGYLLQTPLSGADGQVYAVAQGSISSSSGSGGSSQRGARSRSKETTAFISSGAIIEKQIIQPLTQPTNQANPNPNPSQRTLLLNLIHFDINTANNIVLAINQGFPGSSNLTNSGVIRVQIPSTEQVTNFISNILKIPVVVENKAKVVVDPRSGTIVMGGNVGLSPVAVSKSGMNISIGSPGSAQSSSSSSGLGESGSAQNKGKKQSVMFLEEAPTVSQLVDVLNRLGLTTREIIDILKAVHSAGALHAELIII